MVWKSLKSVTYFSNAALANFFFVECRAFINTQATELTFAPGWKMKTFRFLSNCYQLRVEMNFARNYCYVNFCRYNFRLIILFEFLFIFVKLMIHVYSYIFSTISYRMQRERKREREREREIEVKKERVTEHTWKKERKKIQNQHLSHIFAN